MRWENIASDIRSRIESGEFKPGDRLPSENELVAVWKVSRMTAHRAMQELQRERLVTRRRGKGTLVADRSALKTGQVALLFQHKSNAFEVGYIIGIRSTLPEDCQLVFCSVEENPEREAEYLSKIHKEVDGIICFPTGDIHNVPLMHSIMESGTPIVCIDRIPDGLDADAVVTDNYGSSLTGLQYLVNAGHKRIAYVAEKCLYVSAARERYEAFMQIMKDIGEVDPNKWIRWFPPAPEWEFVVQSLHDAMYRMMNEDEPPTAIFCVHDFYLAAVLEVCERLGISVPDQLEMLSFCDYPTWTVRGSSKVNRLIQQTKESGVKAAEILQRRMAGEQFPKEIIRIPAIFKPAEK